MNYLKRVDVSFETLKGLTLKAVQGASNESEKIIFLTTCGREFHMFHDQYCCEHVEVESVVGEIGDLIGHPILIAEESSSEEAPEGVEQYEDSSHTWTFYKLATIKGYVDIRWHGESNGYYSESVDFVEARD